MRGCSQLLLIRRVDVFFGKFGSFSPKSPKDLKQLETLLGKVHFARNFVTITAHLSRLCRKSIKFEWDADQQKH